MSSEPKTGCYLLPGYDYIGCHECPSLFELVGEQIKICWGVTDEREKDVFFRIKKLYGVIGIMDDFTAVFFVAGVSLSKRVEHYYDKGIHKIRPKGVAHKWCSDIVEGGVVAPRGYVGSSFLVRGKEKTTSEPSEPGSNPGHANQKRKKWGVL